MTMKTAGIAYERSGNGEPLLLLHGTGGSRRHWAPIRPNLAAHHDVIAVDLPGHGESDPPPDDGDHTPPGYAVALAGFLDELGIAAAHTAGDSVGGWTALELAKLGRARSVVAIAPAGLWPRRDPWRCSLKLWVMYRLGRLTTRVTDRALRTEAGRARLLRGVVAKPLNLSEEEARDLIETYNSTATFTKHLAQTRRARFRGGTSLRVPVTVAWVTASGSFPPRLDGRTSSPRTRRPSRFPGAAMSHSGTTPNRSPAQSSRRFRRTRPACPIPRHRSRRMIVDIAGAIIVAPAADSSLATGS
jgi:pimeloyl-ACP methyl ester carboxylesterase